MNIADDSESIRKRMEEIEQERVKQIMGVPIEEPKAVEAPKDVDWASAYGSPSAYQDLYRHLMSMEADSWHLASIPKFIALTEEKLKLTKT